MRFSSESGQATVEAAALLPILFVLLGLFLQPGILLYNRCIMNEAAAEGCRLIATSAADETSLRAYMERRLGPIPKLAVFHEGGSWQIEWSSGEGGARVAITNHAKPLPLFGVLAGLASNVSSDGCIEQRVEAQCTTIPMWASGLGSSPSSWIGAWK